jgi:hypothetical protein
MESSLTSPAANTPGTLVSRPKGARVNGQYLPCPERSMSGPVRTNPFSSRTTAGPSQSVRGEAPMKMNSQLAGTSSVPAESRSMSVSRSRWSPPEAAATSLRYRTSMFGAASIRVMRY